MSVGQTLALARQERRMSVEDVSGATRIRATLIRAIEADDFTPCGGAVYARGHIRSIARVLELDPESVIAEYDRDHADEVPAAASTNLTTGFDREAAARADRKGPNWAAAMIVALVVVCALAGYSLIGGRGHGHNTPTTADGPHTSAPTHPPTTPPAHPTAPSSAVAQLPSDATALIRAVGGTTWMSIHAANGKLLYEGLLNRGASKVFRDAKGLIMKIGNAPAIDLVVNGHDVGTPPSKGNVATLRISPGDANVQSA